MNEKIKPIQFTPDDMWDCTLQDDAAQSAANVLASNWNDCLQHGGSSAADVVACIMGDVDSVCAALRAWAEHAKSAALARARGEE